MRLFNALISPVFAKVGISSVIHKRPSSAETHASEEHSEEEAVFDHFDGTAEYHPEHTNTNNVVMPATSTVFTSSDHSSSKPADGHVKVSKWQAKVGKYQGKIKAGALRTIFN